MSDTIILDTETTGLTKPVNTNILKQPYMTEICAIRVDDNWGEVARVDRLVKCPVPVPEVVTKITGINDKMLVNAPPFIELYEPLFELFFGVKNVIGHNLSFDLSMLKYELFRHDLEYKFNWPRNHICTVEKSYHYFNKRLKLAQLHEHLFNKGFEGAHRALNDVKPTIRCAMEMQKRGDIVLI